MCKILTKFKIILFHKYKTHDIFGSNRIRYLVG